MSKGKKPKRGPSKKTLILNDQLRRKRETRELAKRFLIVCEDDKSAPNYFRSLKRYYKLSASSIEVVGSNGNSQPQKVVERAIQRMELASDSASGTEAFSEIWCVIDGDYQEKIAPARHTANRHGIKLAVSTMCFEYWVILHFEENDTSSNDCDTIVRSLKDKDHLPNYQKGTCDFDTVVPQVELASSRAKKLRRTGELPENQNPCSEIYLLIHSILRETRQATS